MTHEPPEQIESFADEFQKDLDAELAKLPRIAAAIERRERVEVALTTEEIGQASLSLIFLLIRWGRNLAMEVDRLSAELEQQASAGEDLDS